MIVTLFFVRADEDPQNEFRLYETVDESDHGFDSRNGVDRTDELVDHFDEKYEFEPHMWRMLTIRCSD